jgi:hypothetical protein
MSEINEKEIKRRFKAISQHELDPEVTIRDLERTRESLTGQMSKQQAKTKKIWRIIMKSSITKLATAAAIIIAVSVGIHFLGDGSSIAWSQVVEQLNNYTKYKCRQRVVREEGPQIPTMQVYHLNLQQRRQEVEDGSIHIIDMRSENPITVELYPDQKKAVVTNILGFGPKKDPDIIDMVKRFEQQSTERLGTKNVNGKTLQGFRHKPNEYNDFTVWVDPKTKLPVEIELKHPTAKQTIYMDQFAFDFELDESAFSTDVPDGYEVKTVVHDYRPVEQKEISPEDIRAGLPHIAYTVEKLPWMEKLIIMQITDPLMRMGKAYVIGIQSDDGNRMIIVQGDTYEQERMVWIPDQQLVLETPSGIKLYIHPNGSIYARLFLEGFAKANPDFFNMENLSEERFTRMIVMPDRTILGLTTNKQMSDEKLQQLVEALKEIKTN